MFFLWNSYFCISILIQLTMIKVRYESPSVKMWLIEVAAPLLSSGNPAKTGSAQVQIADDGGYYGDTF